MVTGVVTHLCCETTARSAFVRGFQVTFPVDATVTYGEEHHLATLLNLAHGFAAVGFVEDVLAAMGERAGSRRGAAAPPSGTRRERENAPRQGRGASHFLEPGSAEFLPAATDTGP